MLFATGSLLGILGEDHGNAALVGLQRARDGNCRRTRARAPAGRPPGGGGVLATLAVVFFAVLVGSLETWIGILERGCRRARLGARLLVLELLTIGAALVALQRFRAPLLMLPIAVTFALALIDVGAGSRWRSSPGSSSSRSAMRSTGPDGSRMRCGSTSSAAHRSAAACSRSSTATPAWILVGPALRRLCCGSPTPSAARAMPCSARSGSCATTTYFIEDGLSFVGFFVPLDVGEPGGRHRPVADRALLRPRRASDPRARAPWASGSHARTAATRSLNLQFEP